MDDHNFPSDKFIIWEILVFSDNPTVLGVLIPCKILKGHNCEK